MGLARVLLVWSTTTRVVLPAKEMGWAGRSGLCTNLSFVSIPHKFTWLEYMHCRHGIIIAERENALSLPHIKKTLLLLIKNVF